MLVESSSRSLFVESRSWMCQCTCADGCLSVCLRRSSSRRWFQCTATRLLPRGVRESIQTKNERIVSFDVIVHYLNTRHTRPVYCRWLQSSSPASLTFILVPLFVLFRAHCFRMSFSTRHSFCSHRYFYCCSSSFLLIHYFFLFSSFFFFFSCHLLRLALLALRSNFKFITFFFSHGT